MAHDYSKFDKHELIDHIKDLEHQLKSSKYGLYWDRSLDIERAANECKNSIPVLKRNDDYCIYTDGADDYNMLIEGDNLYSLTSLNMLSGNSEFVDVIYIDPPYNTESNTFTYTDNFMDYNDGYKHSKWLSIMEKRLTLAWKLLKTQGTIFVSINGVEVAQLKLLCDSIFGDFNYVGTLTWESTTQPTNAGKAKFGLQQKVEFVLMYTKDYENMPGYTLDSYEKKLKYPHKDSEGKACRYEIIEKSSAGTYNRDTMKFEILGQRPREGKRWQIGERTARKLERTNRVAIVDGMVKKVVYPEDELVAESYVPFWSHFTAAEYGTAQSGKAELNEILGYSSGFDTVKSVDLIKQLLYYTVGDNKEAIILDFFAGSGTTGQAVLELNEEDSGRRRFILCNDNENDICRETTYPRLKAVISGIREDGSVYSEGMPVNLIYYQTDLIKDSRNSDQAKYSLVEKLDELLCIIEDTFILLEKSDPYSHYSNGNRKNHTFIYSDYYNERKFSKFSELINSTEGEKTVYVFSTDNNVDEQLTKDIVSATFKPIPAKIYEIYKEIIENIKRGEM